MRAITSGGLGLASRVDLLVANLEGGLWLLAVNLLSRLAIGSRTSSSKILRQGRDIDEASHASVAHAHQQSSQ